MDPMGNETAPRCPVSDVFFDFLIWWNPVPQVFDFRKGLISFFSQTPKGAKRKKGNCTKALFRNVGCFLETSLKINLWANFKNIKSVTKAEKFGHLGMIPPVKTMTIMIPGFGRTTWGRDKIYPDRHPHHVVSHSWSLFCRQEGDPSSWSCG